MITCTRTFFRQATKCWYTCIDSHLFEKHIPSVLESLSELSPNRIHVSQPLLDIFGERALIMFHKAEIIVPIIVVRTVAIYKNISPREFQSTWVFTQIFIV